MEIIIKKNYIKDEDDPLGIGQAQINHLKELPISEKEENPVDKWLCANPIKSLIGKKAYALTDKKETISGWIVDVYVSRHLLIKCFKDKENRPVEFESVISIGD